MHFSCSWRRYRTAFVVGPTLTRWLRFCCLGIGKIPIADWVFRFALPSIRLLFLILWWVRLLSSPHQQWSLKLRFFSLLILCEELQPFPNRPATNLSELTVLRLQIIFESPYSQLRWSCSEPIFELIRRHCAFSCIFTHPSLLGWSLLGPDQRFPASLLWL